MLDREMQEMIQIYQNKKLVLWGAGFMGRLHTTQLLLHEIEVIAVCDKNYTVYGSHIDSVPIISPDELGAIVQGDDSIVAQITVDISMEVQEQIAKQIKELGIEKCLFFSIHKIQYALDYIRLSKESVLRTKFEGSKEANKIRLTKIDDELTIYNNKVILWGYVDDSLRSLIAYHKIVVHAIVDYDNSMKENELNGIKVISMQELERMKEVGESMVLQSSMLSSEGEMLEYIQRNGIETYIVYREARQILDYLMKCKKNLSNVSEGNSTEIREKWRPVDQERIYLQDYLNGNRGKERIFICMAGKTGDVTLGNTLEKHKVEYFNILHRPELLVELMGRTNDNIKVITAIRDPIGQMLSTIYQWFTSGSLKNYLYYWCKPFEVEAVMKQGGDVQYILDGYLEFTYGKKTGELTNVGRFFSEFERALIDIKQTPFNKEKGCTIIQEGNVEVFIYQLEKMNSIIPELSEFLGTPFDKWEMGNVASDKWIAESYKQAQKEIKLPRAYFEMCYNDPYIQHFYSQEDIERFKERWRGHIRD